MTNDTKAFEALPAGFGGSILAVSIAGIICHALSWPYPEGAQVVIAALAFLATLTAYRAEYQSHAE